jgi:hypothetical protein
MAELKTKLSEASVTDFLNTVEPEQKRKDCLALVEIMQRITNHKAKMWGASIVGFGAYHYKYASGRESDFLAVGFSPRKQNITLYIMAGFTNYDALLASLGKYKTGKSCLYINQLEDIKQTVLEEIISDSYEYITTKVW